MSMKRLGIWLLALCLPVLFIGCSKKSSSNGDSAAVDTTNNGEGAPPVSLQVADKVSVVDAKLSNSVAAVAPLRAGLFKVTAADFGAATDYKKDKTNIWVSERSAESFGTINMILCMTGETKYAEMLNKGPYIALVDTKTCDAEKSGASSSGSDSQSQSSDATQYESFTVISSRESNSAPQIVKMWIHEKAEPQHQEPEKVILAKLTITESKNDVNPYGMFQMDFIAYEASNGAATSTTPFFKGTLKTEKDDAGKILLKLAFDEARANRTGTQRITLDRSADGSTGAGSVYDYSKEGTQPARELAFDIAFNSTHFFRKDNSGLQVCLNRTDFDESAWRFGLYDAAGARVRRNSGFSINTKADGSGAQGWVGFGGLWMNNNGTLASGDTVYKYDYGTGASAPFTVFTAKGKLMKHTRKTLTLGAIKGIPLQYSEFSGSTNTNYQVSWDGTDFVKTAYMPQCNGGNCMWNDLQTRETISFGNLQWGELNLWSQSLGGQVRVPLTGCVQTFPVNCQPGPSTFCQPKTTCTPPTDALNIIFFAEDLVYPTDTVPATLECYDNCPNAPTAAGVNLALNNGFVNSMMSGPSKTAVDYSFNSASMNLMLNGNPVILPSIPAGSQNQHGINSGPLFDPTAANMVKLQCDYADFNGVFGTCGWKAWSVLDVFYTWQTGPDNWNQFTALKDNTGAFLNFEPPLQVKYVHHKAPFDGSTFMLDYSGFGQLNGIPGKCVNMDSGLKVDCATSNADNSVRWVPAFVIPPKQADGSLTSVEAGGKTYYVKPLEMEQRMKAVSTADCASLTLTHFALPNISIWVDPAISTEPTVTTAPKVIGGVVQ